MSFKKFAFPLRDPLTASAVTLGFLLCLLASSAAIKAARLGRQPVQVHVLTPAEKDVVRDPFPPASSRDKLISKMRLKLADHRFDALLPASHRSMGWKQSDEEYWRATPTEARSVPADWSQMPAVKFTNSEIGGTREIRFRKTPHFDQWLLKDPLHDLTAFISVDRATRRAYFGEVTRSERAGFAREGTFDKCYVCHASGPRVIRPLNDKGVNKKTLAKFNKRLLEYGACNFGDTVDPDTRGPEYADVRCTSCHDGRSRGKLYLIHRRSIDFKTDLDKSMPLRTARSVITGRASEPDRR